MIVRDRGQDITELVAEVEVAVAHEMKMCPPACDLCAREKCQDCTRENIMVMESTTPIKSVIVQTCEAHS